MSDWMRPGKSVDPRRPGPDPRPTGSRLPHRGNPIRRGDQAPRPGPAAPDHSAGLSLARPRLVHDPRDPRLTRHVAASPDAA